MGAAAAAPPTPTATLNSRCRPNKQHCAGVQLLPESYAVLIYAAMESVTPPDLEVAKALFSALSSTGGWPSQGGALLHSQPLSLFRCC